jgi:hypothetical protein
MRIGHWSSGRLLMVGAGVMLLLAGPIWNLCLCEAEPPPAPEAGPGWAYYGREHLHGPQALAGTFYNLPFGGSAEGCGIDGCVVAGRIKKRRHGGAKICDVLYPDCGTGPCEVGGSWYWMCSPEQERTAVASLFNRYCIRCHGVDGRGVWDIPGVPDFTNQRWQLSRSDDQIARIIIEGRGAVMPTFRGTVSLEQAWGLARYLRTLVPGTETPRPDTGKTDGTAKPPEKAPPPKGP